LLTNELAVGTRITVVKRTGFNWDNNLYGDNKIASFLRAAPAVWYTKMGNIVAQQSTSFDSSSTSFDAVDITFDIGL
jgi:hypothetical protein